MADKKDNVKNSIFSKVLEAGEAYLDMQIQKAKNNANSKRVEEDDYYSKSVTEDPSFQINSQGYKEKPNRILNSHLKQMSLKDSIVAGVIQTRQSQVANFGRLVKSEQERGWMIVLKNEEEQLRKIKEQLKVTMPPKQSPMPDPNQQAPQAAMDPQAVQDPNAQGVDPLQDSSPITGNSLRKAEDVITDQQDEYGSQSELSQEIKDENPGKSDNEVEEYNWELERRAREKLQEDIRIEQKYIEEFIANCGELDNKPFESKRWNFDTYLRAITRDRLTYDLIATEVVPDNVGKPSYFFPVDGSTIKYASPALKRFKAFPGAQASVDFLYPEKHVKALEEGDALELDEKLLDDEMYKYVQVVKGRIERAFTEEELKVGICNITTDLYNNGYGVAELELLVSIVASHLNTEYYNKAYFTNGFSAKGILHLKAPIPRRKLETIRQQWHHMLKGSKNSFQTPIFAGMDEVNWIPLTQNHSDIEFQGWMNYLIKVISMIYQIDPKEIGFGIKEEGKSGGIGGGDDTEEKIGHSQDKGLFPLLRFLENYLNKSIVDSINPDFELKFVGYNEESHKASLERQEKEVKFKKTVNEIRSEDGLPPLPGMDNMLLDPVYFQWYTMFSAEGKALSEKNQQNQMAMGQANQPPPQEEEKPVDEKSLQDEDINAMMNQDMKPQDPVTKSVKIEYYTLKK